jgi:hypothetical protein
MGGKIFVAYPEEEEKPKEMMLAKKWSRAELDLTQIETDIKQLITMLDNISATGSKYEVDEAKLTVGLTKDENGKVNATIAASFLNLLKGSAGGELSEGISENKLFEIVIKRGSA